MFDESGEVQTARQHFIARQLDATGSPVARVQTEHGWLFANGARIGNDTMGRLVSYREPPFSEEEGIRFELEYVQAALAKERHDFHNFKMSVLSDAENHLRYPNCGAPPDNAVEVLEAGRARINELVPRSMELEKKLLEMPGTPEYVARQRELDAQRERDERREAMEVYKAKVNAILSP